jgi:hypothetical protein
MRRLLIPSAAVAALGALVNCEQQFSASPPPLAPENAPAAASAGAMEALLSGPATDAGQTQYEASRAMTVTLCSASSTPCSSADDASADGSYRVVFGSGRAEIRSRGQAMTDLYKELRDRVAAGDRLVAIARAPRGSGGAFSASSAAATTGTDSGDVTTQGAFHLLDLVDGVGEVTLEVAPRFAATGCLVSLGRPSGDGGAAHCVTPSTEVRAQSSRT